MIWNAVTAIHTAVCLFMNGLGILTQSICSQLLRLSLLDNINDALVVRRCWVSPLSATTIQMRAQWVLAANGSKLMDNCGTTQPTHLLSDNMPSNIKKKNHSGLHRVCICLVRWLHKLKWNKKSMQKSHTSSVSQMDFLREQQHIALTVSAGKSYGLPVCWHAFIFALVMLWVCMLAVLSSQDTSLHFNIPVKVYVLWWELILWPYQHWPQSVSGATVNTKPHALWM